MFRLIPREMKFFELFAELSSNLTEGAKLLRSILENPVDLGVRAEQMQAIEHKGDKATHAIITKLNQTFITPFDREDIHMLSSRMDDVLDLVEVAANKTLLYKLTERSPQAVELAQIIVRCADRMHSAVGQLEKHDHILE